MAEKLNSFFSSVTVDEPPLDFDRVDGVEEPEYVLRDLHITAEKVRKKPCKFKANKASVPDNISVNVLRQCPLWTLL